MTQTLKLKRSAVQGRAPTTSDLELGELAINTTDGKIYIKKSVSGTESIISFVDSSTTAPVVDTMTGDGSDTTLSLSVSPASENQTFLTIDGVLQHKDTYSISGSTLTFDEAPANTAKVECITFVNTTITEFKDGDGDTKIQVEESSDEDKVRVDTGGTERAVIDSSGLTVTGAVASSGNMTENSKRVATNGRAVAFSLIFGQQENKLANTKIKNTVLDASVISGQSTVTAASGDFVLIQDISDSNNLKKALVSDLGGSSDSIADADGDTKIQVEESSDEDTIRFDTAGTERANISSSGLAVTGNITEDSKRVATNGRAVAFSLIFG